MKLSWNWLMELCDFSRMPTPAQGAEALTRVGIEVESLVDVGAGFSGVVVAEVVAFRPHPSSDKLRLVDVRDSRDGAPVQVVCGAPNVPPPGHKVLWAKPGATLPGGITLAVRAVKGIDSPGMLCSHDELATGEGDEGIVVLPPNDPTPLGERAQVALGIDDWMLEIGVPANRPDLLGHLGVAWELCAALGGRVVMPDMRLDDVSQPSQQPLAVGDLSRECQRFVARRIEHVKVAPSPLRISGRLRTVGVRPISNVVDATNYVMFEVGQPLHAFDAAKLGDAPLGVRAAVTGETFLTLDQQARTLVAGDLLVCAGERPVALAGVMGGANSEVDASTTSIVLESARFSPKQVRRTARRLGLLSEASARFERGVDAARCEEASARAARLIALWSGGKVQAGVVDPKGAPSARAPITVRPARVQRLLGMSMSSGEMVQVLAAQGFEVEQADNLRVTVPSWRSDVTREVDVIEEVVRLFGIDRVPDTLPSLRQAPAGHTSRSDDARVALTRAGLMEAITFGFHSEARLVHLRLPPDDLRAQPLRLTNPMSAEQSVLRTSLVPNLLAAVARNVSFRRLDVALFEVGTVFWPAANLADEPLFAAGVLTGKRPRHLADVRAYDVFDAIGVVEAFLRDLGFHPNFENHAASPFLHPGVAATIRVDGVAIGVVGQVHPRVAQAFDIPPTFLFEVNVSKLPVAPIRTMQPIGKFPAATRDVSLLLDVTTPVGAIRERLATGNYHLLESAQVVDDYRSDHLPAGKKSSSWTMSYRALERTLLDAEVDAAHEALVADLCNQLGAQRR